MHRRALNSLRTVAGAAIAALVCTGTAWGGGPVQLAQASGATKASPAAKAGPATTNPSWGQTVDAARKEGAVTIYSSQGLVLLNDLADRFKKEYGVSVTVVRGVDSDNWPKIDAE